MKKQILCFSGWAQKANSLEKLFTKNTDEFEIINFDYSNFNNFEDFCTEISNLKINPEIIIGWSLGGQLSCRLIEKKILNPNYLILISCPFQFVKSKEIAAAMPRKSFDEFYNNFSKNPAKTLNKFSLLMNVGNRDATGLAQNLDINEENHQKLVFWLKELEKFSSYELNFTNFPKSLIFHGSSDLVVHVSHGKIFQEKIANSQLEVIQNCGHTPHINHENHLKEKILDFLK